MQPTCLIESGDVLGEVPIWDGETGRIWWVDVSRAILQSFDISTGAHEKFRLPGTSLGGWAFRAQGGMVVSLDTGLYAFSPQHGIGERLAELLPLSCQTTHRTNESAVDSQGRFWIGTMGRSGEIGAGTLRCVGPDLGVREKLAAITTPNGLCFSPDGEAMYFTDSHRRLIWKFRLEIETGRLLSREIFCDLTNCPGRPDGAALDEAGYLWSSAFGASRILRIDPRGRIDTAITLPVSKVTSVAFGGPDMRTLFCTTASGKLTPDESSRQPLAGSLFAIALDTPGFHQPKFAG